MNNKKSTLLMSSVLIVFLLTAMMSPAFAASNNWVDIIVPVRQDDVLMENRAPRLVIEEYAPGEFTDQPQRIRLILDGAEWLNTEEYNDQRIADDTIKPEGAEITAMRITSTTMEFNLTASGDGLEKERWRIPLYVEITGTGEIGVNISSMGSRVTGGVYPYADVVGTAEEDEPEEPAEPEEPEPPQEPEEPEAPEMPAATEVAFTIGQTGYWVDGQWMVSDIAPYIQPTTEGLGRIMVPVRFVAEATGADDVIWDPIGRNVIVLKGDTQLQMTIGSTQLLVNGEVMDMDAVAEIQDIGGGLGRTMVPLAHLARALDVSYQWNPETRSVTFSVVE